MIFFESLAAFNQKPKASTFNCNKFYFVPVCQFLKRSGVSISRRKVKQKVPNAKIGVSGSPQNKLRQPGIAGIDFINYAIKLFAF
jgi:hypothetical protein